MEVKGSIWAMVRPARSGPGLETAGSYKFVERAEAAKA